MASKRELDKAEKELVENMSMESLEAILTVFDSSTFSEDELLLHFEAIFEKVIKQHLATAVKMNED